MATTIPQLLVSFLVVAFLLTTTIGLLAYTLGFQWLATIGLLVAPVVFRKRWYKWVYILYKTLPRDVTAGLRFLKLHITFNYWQKKTLHELFKAKVDEHPDKVCYYFEDAQWTYSQMEELSNKFARYFKSLGFKKGDTVSLLLESRPEYICAWLGLSKIGIVTALINTNLRNQPLLHSFTAASSQAIIFGSDYAEAMKEIQPELSANIKLVQYNTTKPVKILQNSIDLSEEFKSVSGKYLGKDLVTLGPSDKLLYVFTSGTTGLPKAAVISQMRLFFMIAAVHNMMAIRRDDIIYVPLPLYHSAGGIAGSGQALLYGVSCVIRQKFSASNFWKDCVKYKCTAAQYIGEICRYLLAVPPGDPAEKNHTIRRMFGNGLRTQIWNTFVERFNIKEVGEFYGATEGNSNLVNFEGVPGAVGFKPRYIGNMLPIALIRVDEATGTPLKDNKGFCISCGPNEPGILIGKINRKNIVNDFAGYTDPDATKKKILKNVFSKGDCYFNSGDILVMDEFGYYYFKDRTGDTFRWKGENVATSEVEGVISNVVSLQDAAVYGVQVPNTEGRCGMAAIVDPTGSINLVEFAKGLRKNLPAYACPVFLRVMKEVPLTGTFKLKKNDIQQDGYDINKIKGDKLYFYDSKLSEFVPITKELYHNIISEVTIISTVKSSFLLMTAVTAATYFSHYCRIEPNLS